VNLKQLQGKADRLTERIIKAQAQLDAWKMERKELRLQIATARTSARTAQRTGRVARKAKAAR
jgi:hypothetical protein